MKQFLLNVQSLLGLMIIAAFTMMACNSYSKKIAFGNNEVAYKGDATEADAQKLGRYLKEGDKYFSDSTHFSVEVEKKNGTYITRMVTNSQIVRSAADFNDEEYQFIAGEICNHVNDGKPVTLEITNEYFKPIKRYHTN